MTNILVKSAGAWVPLVGSAPPPSAFPDSTNTGVPAGTTLTASGDITASTDGQVIDALDITGSINVTANNVVIKRCRINSGDVYCVNVTSGSVSVRDCELTNFSDAAIRYDNWTGLRLNVHTFTGDAFKVGDNVTLKDSWVHDANPGPTAHADGAQSESGSVNLVIQHNTIDMAVDGTNSCVFLKNDLNSANSPGPVLIDNNLLSGGNYSFYAVPGSSGLLQQGITVTNNQFVRGSYQFGAVDVGMNIDTWSGNTFSDNGEEITD